MKIRTQLYKVILTTVFSFIGLIVAFAAVDIDGLGADSTFCVTSAPITLTAIPNTNGTFLSADAQTNGAITNDPAGGICTFDPSIAGLGTHTITYNGGGGGNSVTFDIEVIESTTRLDPLDDVCLDAASFALSGGGGDPAGGIYTGAGVDGAFNFDPATAGVGIHTITYTTADGCAASRDIEVLALPVVTLDPFDPICEDNGAFALSGGNPGGGTYSGIGVVDNFFDPSITGNGTFVITYTFNDGSCSNSDNEDLVVDQLPAVSISNLANAYCTNSPMVVITGNPTDANGLFTGNGIVDNGDGTAQFFPGAAGNGTHTITYTYTNGNGCMNSVSQEVEIGTEVTLTGLIAGYCEDITNVEIIGTPLGGTFTAEDGLTDNGDGTAVFDPSNAGPGTYTIEYEYTNQIGCVTTISQDVEVYPLPTPGFVGLKAEYCTDEGIDLLKGNYAPSGTFSGDGVTDNADGTADFDPGAMAVGGPYSVTYSVTDGNGCAASVTNQTSINPLPTATLSGDATICYGTATTIQVDMTGTAPYNLSYSNGASTTNVTGHGTDTYTTNVSPGANTTYTMLKVTDGNGCSNTGNGAATITVNPEVTITSDPADKTVCEGANTSFTVTATGVGLTYQWKKDGVNIAGATNPVLTLNNVSAAEEADYTCVVSSSCGGPLTSMAATLALYDEISISVHPLDDYLCTGEDLNLSVTASGSNISYQWRKDGVDIPGANLAAYTISGVTTANTGTYSCYVDGSCSPQESNPAEIAIDAPVTITSQPSDKITCEGSNTSFSVTATGTSLTYTWKKSDGTVVGNSQSLIFTNVAVADADEYRCIVASPCGATKTSNTVTLTVETSPAVTMSPTGDVLCEGDNISFGVTATGSNLAYQWQKDGGDLSDGGNIAGANTDQLILSSLIPGNAGDYRCIVNGSCGSATSNVAVLGVDDNITITKQPSDKSICTGSAGTITVEATGSNLTFQWFKNAVLQAGEEESEFNITNADQATDGGEYYCEISNTCGQIRSSNSATITINPLLNITSGPADAIKCEGEDATLKVTATGSNLTYQWIKDEAPLANEGSISGANSKTLVISGLLLTDGGTYYCKVTSDCGTKKSDPADLVVDDEIVIIGEPGDTTVCPGNNLTFSVEATGSNLTYMWQKDGVDMGITDPVLTLNNVGAADEATYRCVITNSCLNTINSQPALLSLYTPVSIGPHPLPVTVCQGGGASFTVTATGSNLQYQWYKEDDPLANTANISGVHTNTLNIAAAGLADDGTYACLVTGSCGSVNSNPASLSVEENTVINTHPKNKTACPGDNLFFSVTASGTNLSYQWQLDNVNIPGATASTFLLNSVDAADEGVYRCIITGNCGIMSSNGATLDVHETTDISSQPAGDVICEDEQATMTISAMGTNLTYQWKFEGTDLADAGAISGSNTPSLSIDPAAAGHTGLYECLVSGSCGNVLSEGASLVVKEHVAITTQPSGKSACPGDNAVFNLVATGSDLAYAWQKDGVPLAGANETSLILNDIQAADEATYKCVVTGFCGTETSQTAALILLEPVIISSQPSDETVCEGESAGMSLVASGSGLTYQWKLNTSPVADGGNISGSSTSTLSLSPATLADYGTYNCEVTGACGTKNSNPAVFTVDEAINIDLQPENLVACEGDDAVFSVNATGSDLTYQWQKNGGNIAGATGPEYIINGVNEADEATYRCVISGKCEEVNSDGASLTIDQDVTIIVQPAANTSVCAGNNLNLGLTATGSNPAYQWMKGGVNLVNGGNISGAQSSNLFINGVTGTDDGIYTCKVTGNCSEEVSILSDVLIKPSTSITQQPVDYNVAAGEDATFSVTAEGYDLTFLWQKDGTDLADGGNISGSATTVLTLSNVAEADEGAYRCIVTGNCNTVNSSPANLVVNASTDFTSQPTSQTRCVGESVSFSVSTSAPSPVYQWKINGTNLSDNANISGSQTANLSISSVVLADAGAYTCEVNSESSIPATLTINEPVTISTHPATRQICEGNDLSFTVTATGTGLDYQWQFNNANLVNSAKIAGATTNTLIISGADATDEGSYHCIVTGVCGIKPSNPGTFAVNETTVITTDPSSATLCEGNTKSFTVAAEGDNLTYSWKKAGSILADGGNINGSSTDNLVVDPVTTADAGSYYATVTGACETENSSIAALSIQQATAITFQPTDLDACQGDKVSFAVSVEGDNISYQWQKDGVDISDGADISGTDSKYLVIDNTEESDAGSYRCHITATCGDVYSESAALSVFDNPVITDHPSSDTVCEGSPASFSITATGTDLVYKWSKNGQVLSDIGNISGSETSTLTITDATSADAGIYTCLVNGNCESANSNPAILVVKKVITIAKHPSDYTGCEGENISLLISATGSDLEYRWQKDFSDINNGGNISGATTPNLKINSSQELDAGAYHCIISGYCGTSNSDPSEVIIRKNTAIATQPGNETLCEGPSLSLNVEAEGEQLEYYWYKDRFALADTGYCSGTDHKTLVISQTNQYYEGLYTVEVTGACGTVTSQAASTNIRKNTSILSQPSNAARCEGEYVIFAVEASGENISFQWQKDGVNLSDGGLISGATTDAITIINLTSANNGNYRCVVTGDCNTVNSTEASLVVSEYPDAAGTITGAAEVCQGDWGVLYEVPAIAGASYYDWSLPAGMQVVSGDSSRAIVVDFDPGESGGNIVVKGINGCGAGTASPVFNVTANPVPVSSAGSDQNICTSTGVLEASDPGMANGTWEVINGPAITDDPNSYNSQVSNLRRGENVLTWTIELAGCSSTDTVKIYNNAVDATAGVDVTICSGTVTLEGNEAPAGATGTWTVISGQAAFSDANSATSSASDFASGLNSLKWSIAKAGCFDSDTVVIDNQTPSKAYAGIDQMICTDSVTMQGNEPVVGTGHWTTLNGSATFDDVNLANAKLSSVALGTNVFRWTIEHEGCISTDETEIRYLYEQAYAGEDQVLCNDQTILNAESPSMSTGYWSIVGGSGTALFDNPDQPDTRVTGLDYGKNTLQWIVQNDICKAVDEVVITNNLPNDAYAGPDQTICGDTTTMAAGEPGIGKGTWSILGGSGSFADSSMAATEIDGLSFGSNTLRWTVEHEGCVLTDDVVIFNNSVTPSKAGEDQVVCYDTAQLNANLPVVGSGEWMIVKGAAIFEDQNLHNTKINHLAQGENILTWHISNGQCESESDVIIVNNTPTQSIAGSDQDVCGKSATLSGNEPEIGTGQWKLISGGGEITSPAANATDANELNPGANVFRWTITKEGCASTDEVTVYNNVPFEANAGTDMTVCSPETRLFANDPGDATGTWSIISGSAVFSDENSHNPDIYEIGFGPNTYEWKIEFEECTSSDVVVITNNKTTVNAGADQVINRSSTTLVASNPTAGTGTWSVIGGAGNFEDSSDMITGVFDIGSGKNTYLWTVEVEGCLSTDEVIVTYEMPAEASFVADTYEGCPPLNVYFVNNSLSELPFIWNFGDNTTSSDVSVMHTFTEPGYYPVSLTVYGDKGEIVTKDTIIHVYDQPVAEFELSAAEIYIPEQDAVFINESQNTVSYLWDFGDGQSSIEEEPIHTYEEEGFYDVCLIAWTEMNCSDTLYVENAVNVVNRGMLEFPNAFTPALTGPAGGSYSNNDYSNDVFHPYGEGVLEYRLEIFNKWGILLFESTDINTGWDGYYKGELVAEGAYVWKVSGVFNNGERFAETGIVVVLH